MTLIIGSLTSHVDITLTPILPKMLISDLFRFSKNWVGRPHPPWHLLYDLPDTRYPAESRVVRMKHIVGTVSTSVVTHL